MCVSLNLFFILQQWIVSEFSAVFWSLLEEIEETSKASLISSPPPQPPPGSVIIIVIVIIIELFEVLEINGATNHHHHHRQCRQLQTALARVLDELRPKRKHL